MTQSKKIIAVTGGIGSGKSTACKILKEWGYPVFSCDDVYSELLEDKKFINLLESRFGKITDKDGKLNRAALSAIVFSDEGARKKLDELSHPPIMEELFKKARNAKSNMVFCEVPLLFENGYEKLFDGVIVINRNLAERVKAVTERSGLTKEQVIERINAQYDYTKVKNNKKIKIVENNGNITSLQSTMRDIITDF